MRNKAPIRTRPSDKSGPPAPPAGRPGARPLDEVDHRLIEVLRHDGRVSVNELAGRLAVSRANAYARLQRLRETGVITGFSARVDPRRVGLPIAALVMVRIEQHQWRQLAQLILELPGVEYLAFTTGQFDFVARVRVPDVDTLRDTVLLGIQALEGVKESQTVFVLDELGAP